MHICIHIARLRRNTYESRGQILFIFATLDWRVELGDLIVWVHDYIWKKLCSGGLQLLTLFLALESMDDTVSGSAAAWATVLGGGKKASLCQRITLAKTGAPDTGAVMIHTEKGWGMMCTLCHQTLTLSLQWRFIFTLVFCACIVCLHLMQARTYMYSCRIFSAHRWHQLSSLAWLICQTAILFAQVCPRPSVTSTHSPRCELNHLWKGWIHTLGPF